MSVNTEKPLSAVEKKKFLNLIQEVGKGGCGYGSSHFWRVVAHTIPIPETTGVSALFAQGGQLRVEGQGRGRY